MNCNVCGRKLKADCKNCGEELDEREFHCYDDEFLSGHFCSKGCWKEWIIKETESNLEVAEAD